MIDAVNSGGYGVLGLYAVQAPVVPDPPRQPAVAASPDAPVTPAAAIAPAAAVGSAPVAASEPGADGGATAGRDFSNQEQTMARQTAVAVSLAATASEETGSPAASGLSAGARPTLSATRAARAYGRTGSAGSSGSSAARPLLSRRA